MKCFICRHLFSDSCPTCNFEPKTDADIVAEGVLHFELKMAPPQYAHYKDNQKAQDHLLADCIREAGLRNRVNTISLGRL